MQLLMTIKNISVSILLDHLLSKSAEGRKSWKQGKSAKEWIGIS